uniref:6-phosphofructokinase n=1 Tax=Setaria digitata TaxID=48799 RepID=A0A915Q3E9_9BILA
MPAKNDGRMSQLKLLMRKNFLQQIRSPIFTALEFIVPLLLIGITFGLMVGLRYKYELSHPSTVYKPWLVQGSVIDLIMPPDFAQIFVDTIVDTQYILSGKTLGDECIFLNVTRQSKDNNITANIDLEVVYTPSNDDIDEIMRIIQKRYTSSNILQQIEQNAVFTKLEKLGVLPKFDLNATLKISSTVKVTPKKSENELVKYIMDSLSATRCNNPILGGVVFDQEFANSVNTSDNISYSIRLSNTKRRYRPLLSTLLPWNTRIKFAVPIRIGPLFKLNPSGGSPGYWQEGFLTLQKAVDVAVQQYLSIDTNSPITLVPLIMLSTYVIKSTQLQRFPYPPFKNIIIELGVYFLPTVVAFSFLINVIYITRTIVVEKETRMKSYMKVMGLSQWILWLSYFISNLIKLSINVIALSIFFYFVTPKSDPTVALVLFSLYAFNVIYVAFAVSAFLHSGAAAMQIIPFVWVALYGWHLLFNIKDLISPFSPTIRLLNALNPDIALTYGLGFICQHETLGSGMSWSQIFVGPTPDESLTLAHFFLMLIVDVILLSIITWYVEALNPGFDGISQKPYFFLQFKKETKAVSHLHTKMYFGQITVLLGQNGAGKSTIFSILTGILQPTSGTAYIEGHDIRKELSKIQARLGFCPQYNILKGRKWQLEEANDLLHRLKIDHKAHVYGYYLSGGQKRKLSLAISLIGCSEIVLLDEPTSGMDPDSRHETWSLLQAEKKRRTILLTTHYMDEADILGDRITIVAYGQLQCTGGEYRLTILYKENKKECDHSTKVFQTLALLRQFIPSVVIQSSNGFEVTFLLPADQRHEVCQRAAEKLEPVTNDRLPEDNSGDFKVSELGYENRLEGYPRYLQHFRAMFYKRFIYLFRKRTFFLLELLFPAICMLLIMEACMMIPVPKEQPSLPINFEPYGSRGIIININVQNTTAAYFQESLPEVMQEAASTSAMNKYPFRLTATDNITRELIESLAQQKDRAFGLHNPVGYSYFSNLFAHDWFIAMFNNYALHSPPLAINLADMAIARRSTQRNISIQVSNHPLPPASTDTLKSQDVINQAALTIGFAAIMSLSAVIMCGLRHWTYWLTTFLWDFTVFLIPATLCIGVFFIVDLKELIDRSTVTLTVYLVMLLYASAELPFVYWCSALFASPTNGNATICVYNFVTGMIGAVAVSIVEKASGRDVANTLSIIFASLFPTYNLSLCFSKAYTNEYTHEVCQKVDCSLREIRLIAKECCGDNDERLYVDNILLSTNRLGIALMVLFFVLHSIIFWLAITAYEADLVRRVKQWLQKESGTSKKPFSTESFETFDEDTDVMMEREKVHQMGNSDALVIARNLEKWFGNLNAVKKINFHVAKGECFGLLGVNGAGKTTTFQILTGERKSDAGSAYIHGFNVQSQWRKIYDHTGYCPQFDALLGEMTGRETLEMFTRLRGVRECDVSQVTDATIRAVALDTYRNHYIKTYSELPDVLASDVNSELEFHIKAIDGHEGSFIKKGKYKGRIMGLFTSGGDAPGMNSAVRAIVRVGLYLGARVFCIHEGYQGMVDGGKYIKEATWETVSDIIQKGGTIIGSARCKDFRERTGRLKAAENLIRHGITALVCIGGDGSLTGANTFRNEWSSLVAELLIAKVITKEDADKCKSIQIVGIVGSIDNDFCGTDMTIGTDTALHRITEAVDSVRSTAHSHQRCFVVEVMGRNCGYLALAASLALDADFCFIPEWPPPTHWKSILCKKLKQMREDGNRVNIVIVAEGAIDHNGSAITSAMIQEVIKKNLKYDTRITILGHIQRGGSPSAFDRLLGCRMGAEAAIALLEMNEETEPCVVSIDGNQVVRIPLMKCVERTKAVKTAMDMKNWAMALKLRGRGFRRNVEMYRTLSKIRKHEPASEGFNIAIMNVGSPSAGCNAAVMSCVRTAILQGCVPYCIYNSNEGLATGQFQKMEWNDVAVWSAEGGSFLGAQRGLPDEDTLPLMAKSLLRFNIHSLIIIGGFNAYHTCLIFAQNRKNFPPFRIPMCVIPSTINNNVPGTGFTLGADTSLNEICKMIDKIKQSATGSKRRVFVIETMGGYCGYLATLSAMASGADAAYIYEEIFDVHELINDIRIIAEKMQTGAQRYLIVRNEKASQNYTSEFIRQLFTEEGKGTFSTRTNVLGHTQQGGNPSPFDRLFGAKMGARAVVHLLGQMKEFKKSGLCYPGTATLQGLIGKYVCLTPVEELVEDADFVHRLPMEQWWMKLRPLLRILAKHD